MASGASARALYKFLHNTSCADARALGRRLCTRHLATVKRKREKEAQKKGKGKKEGEEGNRVREASNMEVGLVGTSRIHTTQL